VGLWTNSLRHGEIFAFAVSFLKPPGGAVARDMRSGCREPAQGQNAKPVASVHVAFRTVKRTRLNGTESLCTCFRWFANQVAG
jgi:hypothetical protein